MSFHFNPNVTTDGLVLYLDAANPKSYPGTGTTWYDLSGNGNNGVLAGSPIFSNNSFLTNGVDQSISVSNISQYNLSFTVSMWVNIISISKNIDIFTRGEFPACYMLLSNNTVYLHIRDDDTSAYVGRTFTGSNIIGTGNSMLTFTYNGGTTGASVIFYKNDTVLTTNDYSFPTFTAPKQNASSAYFSNFNGYTYSLMVYNKVLSNDEIGQNYKTLKGRFGL